MVFPPFYVHAGNAKLFLSSMLLINMAHAIDFIVIMWYSTRFVWISEDISAANIPYVDTLPTWMQSSVQIGINNLMYFVLNSDLIITFLSILLIQATIGGAKNKYMYAISRLFQGLFFVISASRSGFLAVVLFLDCKNYTICRTTVRQTTVPYYPETIKNVYFTVMVVAGFVSTVFQLIQLFLMIYTQEAVAQITVDEKERTGIERVEGDGEWHDTIAIFHTG